MTDAPNGWPDPQRPGVPMNTDKDGWHWLVRKGGGLPVPHHWATGIGGGWSSYSTDSIGLRYHYLGPCHTPAEVATLRALAAENARLREALETAKAAITDRDGLNEFAIQDTIWADKTETLLDHIDAALTGDTP